MQRWRLATWERKKSGGEVQRWRGEAAVALAADFGEACVNQRAVYRMQVLLDKFKQKRMNPSRADVRKASNPTPYAHPQK